MLHLPALISDLTIILIAAAAVTILFKFLKQPLVLGYVIAGFLVSSHVTFLPTISDSESIKIWADIGVVFLLFALGLEFSFKKLMSVGGPASITGIVEVSCMLILGFTGGHLLGFSTMDSLFLGGILSISSTSVIIRAFDELGVKNRKFASLVFGVLVIEDLVAILLLVILSTIGVSQQFRGDELIFSIVKLGFFLALWFIGGTFLLPLVLKKIKHFLNEEMILIISLALCFMMVYFASFVGFSPALGAFIMGSLLAGTNEGKRIEHLVQPVRDLFAAIYFVSVGMLINPDSISVHWSTILIITVLHIVGKIVSSTLGSLISGQRLKHSIQVGFSLAQIGEFSFIIATLGLTLKVTSDFLYPVAVAVSVVTTFTTPYLIKYAEPFALWLEKKLPDRTMQFINNYSASTQAVSASSEAAQALKAFLLRLLLMVVVIVGVSITGGKVIFPWVVRVFGLNTGTRISAFVLTFISSSPFFWAMLKGKINSSVSYFTLSERFSFLPHALNVFRYLVATVLLVVQLSFFFPVGVAAFVFLFLCMFLVNFSKKLGRIYDWFEETFMTHLNSDDKNHHMQKKIEAPITPWDAYLAKYEISAHFAYLGITLENLKLRERCGVTLVMIERGDLKIKAPGKDERLFPFDTVSVLGTDEQLQKFKLFTEETTKLSESNTTHDDYVLLSHTLLAGSEFLGKTIRHSGLREKTDGLVVGLERNNKRILNPDSNLTLEEGDFLWIVGNQKKIKDL